MGSQGRVVWTAIALMGGFGLVFLAAWIGLNITNKRQMATVQSFLAPVMAADALDTDLRVIYARSMVLDALEAQQWGAMDIRLGAEIRRFVLDAQSQRLHGDVAATVIAQIAEIADTEIGSDRAHWARLRSRVNELRETLHQAPEHVESRAG